MTKPTLPKDAIAEIERGVQYWRDSDTDRWMFSEVAANVVGKYIPFATELLAQKIGGLDVSSIQGYAKAHNLKLDLKKIRHNAPAPNLYISHYIVCGKAFFAKDSSWTIGDIDALLREANKWGKSVKWIRAKLGNVTDDDSYINSATKTIQDLEAHIINTSFLGADENMASLSAKIAGCLVRSLQMAIGNKPFSLVSLKKDLEDLIEIYENMFPVEEKEGSHE